MSPMVSNPRRVFLLLLLLTLGLIFIDLPENYRLKFSLFGVNVDRIISPPIINLNFLGTRVQKSFRTQFGLDLAGGTHVTLEADMRNIAAADRGAALESAKPGTEG